MDLYILEIWVFHKHKLAEINFIYFFFIFYSIDVWVGLESVVNIQNF